MSGQKSHRSVRLLSLVQDLNQTNIRAVRANKESFLPSIQSIQEQSETDLAKINGSTETVFVDRALAELRCGRVVRLNGGQRSWLIAALECCPARTLEELQRLSAGRLELILSEERAEALGLDHGKAGGRIGAVALRLPPGWSREWLHQLVATPVDPDRQPAEARGLDTQAASSGAGTALTMVKLAHLVPAVLVWELRGAAATEVSKQVALGDILMVTLPQVQAYVEATATKLIRVGEAKVPLSDSEETRFVVFRAASSGIDHVAIVIGEIDSDTPVLVRLHSACLTGDLFGSLRCDCGEQLRTSVQAIADAGGGIILYLAQEGRGIGLTNKLRAYWLQDRGFDTLDANNQLGFKDDERRYEVAAEILKMLDIERVTLMTNNPAKIDALESSGITIESRKGVPATINPHNERYMTVRAEKIGHILDE